MTKLNVLIVDDEPMAQKVLEVYCAKIPDIHVSGVCSNAVEAMSFLQEGQVDLVFIDINMPEISGIDFVRSMKNRTGVIFTTAYSEYAVESYTLNALDYLLKPISFERFLTAIAKAQQSLKASGSDDLLSTADNAIFVKSNGKRVRIDLDELLYIEGLKDYVKFCLREEKIVVHGSLKKIETYIARYKNFVRVHKSYLVNITKIKEFDSQEIRLQVNNILIPVGQTYYSDLEEAISGKKY